MDVLRCCLIFILSIVTQYFDQHDTYFVVANYPLKLFRRTLTSFLFFRLMKTITALSTVHSRSETLIQLRELFELKNMGAILEEEYEQKKKILLKDI